MPAQTCYVPGCKNGYSINYKRKKIGFEPMSLFRPPQDMIEKWNAIIQRKDRKLRKDDIVCTLHFREEDIEHYYSHIIDGKIVLIKRGYPKLKPGVIPCIFKNEKGIDKKASRRCKEVNGKVAKEEEKSLPQKSSYSDNKYAQKKTSSEVKYKRIKNKNQKVELTFKDDRTSDSEYAEIDMRDHAINKTYIPLLECCRNSQGYAENLNHDTELSFKEEHTVSHESNFTFEELIKNVNSILLPSPLWAVHKHPRNRFLSFSHTTLHPDGGVKFDKGIVFEGSCSPVIIFYGHHVPIPQLSKDVTSITDVCKILDELEEFRAVCLLSETPSKDVIALEN